MLTFTDLSGVFYCVIFGMVTSVLVLLGELFIEAHKDTRQNNKEVVKTGLYIFFSQMITNNCSYKSFYCRS